jgi:hypothetical protein
LDQRAIHSSNPAGTTLPAKSTSTATIPTWQKYISAKDLFGIISIFLMLISLTYGFVFTGLPHSNTIEIQLGWAELVPDGNAKGSTSDDDITDLPSNAPLTVVIKLNTPTDSPIQYILPLQETTSGLFAYGKTKDQIFQMNRNEVVNTNYTLVIREGNIPIHFETIHGTTFVEDGRKDIFSTGSHRAYYLEINNLPQNEIKLKHKIIKIHYCIHK